MMADMMLMVVPNNNWTTFKIINFFLGITKSFAMNASDIKFTIEHIPRIKSCAV